MAQSRQVYDSETPVLEGVPAATSVQSVTDVDSCYLAQRSVRHLACLFGVGGMLIGALGLIARVSGSVLLGSFIPHTKVISPSSVLSLLASGGLVVAVALIRNDSLRRLRVYAYLLMSLQALALLEHYGVISAHVAALLIPDHFPVQTDSRASIPASLCFVMLSLCFVLWPQWHRRHLVVTLAAAAGALALAFALGYAYRHPLLYGTRYSPVAVPTATGIISVGIGLFLAALASLLARQVCGANAETVRRETLEELTAELRARGDQLEAVVSSIADAVSITDANGVLVRYNDAARRMLRYESYEDASWDERVQRCTYLHPDGTAFAHDDLPLSRSLRGETVTGEILHMIWPDGTWRWVTSSSGPLTDPEGNITGAVVTNSDMTALHETQQQTQRLLAQVQAEREWMFCLLDTLPAYVCLIRPDHQIAYANGRFKDLFGTPADGEKCYERILGCSHACEDCRAFQPLTTGQPVNYEWRHPHRNLVLDVTNYAFTDLDGCLVSLEVGVEVTARVTAEQELQRHRDHLEDLVSERTIRLGESERQYRELVESATAAILRFDHEGRLTLANRYAHELFGYAPGELVGQPATIILPERDSTGANLKFIKDALLHDPTEWQYNENENITKDGRLLWLSWSNHVTLDEAGEPRDVLSVGIDRTEQHEGERQLRDYQKRLRALTSDVVNAEQRERQRVATLLHDEVAQTLGALKLHLSILPGRWPEAAGDVAPLITMADDAVQQTRSIMTELSPPILQRFGIVEALRWWAQTIQEREPLRVRVDAPDTPIVVDPVRRTAIFQAVKELLRNVIRHSGASEAIVMVQADHATLHVEVSDNGNGFDPHTTTTTATAGFGLFGIKERMIHLGGSMTVISRPQQGTSIVLRLPRSS